MSMGKLERAIKCFAGIVAERCARACGLPRRYKETPLHPESCLAHITEQVKVKNRWINLPLDPYFWRPRLEDELTKIVVGKWEGR